MPSLIRRLYPFSSKKKGHHGSKFQDQSYDNQRFPPYHNITQNLPHPHYYQHQQPQQSHLLHQTNLYHNQYQQVTSPPFAFSPRHQHQSQFQQQNTLVQSPQLISSPAVASPLNQCHCQHCTQPNQLGYGQHNQANLGQLVSSPQAVVSPPVASPQMQMMNSQVPLQPQTTLPVQSIVSNHQASQHLQQHQQSVPLMHEHQLVQQQSTLQSSQQHHTQLHLQNQQQQIGSPVNDMPHQYANQIGQQGTIHCTCHSCPSHQALREIGQPTQQYHQSQLPPHINGAAQQQLTQHSHLNPTHMNQHMDLNQTSNACQHQMMGAQLAHNQMIAQSSGTQYNNTSKSRLCSPQDQSQNTSMLAPSSSPRIASQELSAQQQHQQIQCQQQYSNTEAMSVPQFHYHTIQPNQYQHQKQQMAQEQPHQRIQSLHHQVSRSPNQLNEKPIAHVIESATRSYPQVDSRVYEFSRYANVRSIMSESSQSSKYQEHVYCNQKPEPILPSYEFPPSYETFIANKDSYVIGLRNHHMTHHSESLVSQKTKDSSYENLRRFSPYGNFDANMQEPGLTT